MAMMSLDKSKSMMQYSEWEGSLLCSMMDPVLIPSLESPSEDIQSLSFVSILRKYQEELNLFPKVCSSSSQLEDTPTKKSSITFPMNGKREVSYQKVRAVS